MKKLVCICAALILAVFLSACGLKKLKNVELPPLPQVTEAVVTPKPTITPIPTAVPTPEPTDEPTAATETVLQEEPVGLEGQIIVRFKETRYEQFDPEDGKERILSFSYETPYVTIEGYPEASAVINGQIAFMDDSFYSGTGDSDKPGFNAMLELAEDNYAYARQNTGKEIPLELYATRTVKTARVDQKVVSMVFRYEEYTGGSNPPYSEVGCVFDARTGELVTLNDLSSDYKSLEKRLLHCLVSLTESDKSLYDHVYISYMNGDYYRTLGKLLRQGAWYFDEKGMVFVSSLYELGPYIAGLAEFHIPYSKLSDCLDEKWLPSGRTETGNVSISSELSENGGVSFLDRVEVDRRGKELCLTVQGTLYSVKLSSVYYIDKFYMDRELWFCSEMKDSALQLVSEIPEGLPNLRLSYRDIEGKNHKLLVTADADGTVRLTDEKEIAPVG